MKKTSDIPETGNKSGQVDTTPRGSSPISSIRLIVLGASLFVLVALTIVLYRLFMSTEEYGLLTYFSGMLAIAVFLWLAALLASRLRKKKTVPPTPKVRAALISTLQKDSNPDVRFEAAKGLAELDLEESTEHHEHSDLDTILISTLQQDPDPRVRSAAAEGLAELELEQSSYHHKL